jgi:DNA-binding beta-propeller fold protein YncE
MVALKTPTDLEVDENNNVYIVDRDNNRVIVLDPYYKLKFIIDSFKNVSGNVDVLNAPQGVFITKDKNVNGVIEKGRIFRLRYR